MTPNLYRMSNSDLRILVRDLQEEARLAGLTRAASFHSLNKILGELRRAEECADRLRTQRDRAVDQYKDTHKDLLIVESQVTAFGLRVEEGEAKYRLLSKQWSFLLSHKNYAERQVGKLRADVKQLKSEAVSNQAHISFHMGKAEGGSQCVQQLRTQVEALKEENARLDHASVRYFMDQQTTKVNEALSENDELRGKNKTFEEERDAALRDCETFRAIRQKVEDDLQASIRETRLTREERDKLGEEWNKLLEQKQALEKNNDKLRRQWHISEECLDSSLTREKGRDERLSELQAERNQLNRDLAKANAILSCQEEKDRTAKLRLENMRASRDIWHRKGLELKAEIQCLIEERDKAEAKVGDLAAIKADQAMRIVRDERDDLRSQMNAAVAQVGRLNRMRGLDEVSLNAARKSVQDRYAEIRKLEDALACKERRIDNLEEDRIHYLDNVAEKNKRISELVTELDGARKALKSKGTAALCTENVVLLHEKDALLAKKHKLGQQLQQADRQDDRRCMRIAYLQEAGEQLASDLATTQAKVRVLEHRLGRLTSGETLAALGISDLEHKEQITRLEEEIRLVRTENLDLLNRLGKRRIALSYKNERIIKLRKKLREGSPDRIRALTEGLASTKEQLDIVASAYNALHLETEAITTFVPAVPRYTGGKSRFPGGPLRCVYCQKEFKVFQDAKDKEQHEPDCCWVELEQVAVMTEQDVLLAANKKE